MSSKIKVPAGYPTPNEVAKNVGATRADVKAVDSILARLGILSGKAKVRASLVGKASKKVEGIRKSHLTRKRKRARQTAAAKRSPQ